MAFAAGNPQGKIAASICSTPARLVHEAPTVYATFLLWLLAELFEQLPERGDADKPLLTLFFDEAHLLFADTPKALQDKGTPEKVQRVLVAPPQSRIGPLSESERAALIAQSLLAGRYDKPIDRESAYEMLLARKGAAQTPTAEEKPQGSFADMAGGFLGGLAGQAVKTAMRQAANQLGRELVRGLMGSLLGGSKKRR